MNNTERKLDALIDALGFDVEVVDSIVYGEIVPLGKMVVGCASKEWEYLPEEEVYKEVLSRVYYKLTKREDAALSLLREIVNGDPAHVN